MWAKPGTNSNNRYLLLNLFIKPKIHVVQNKIYHPYKFIRFVGIVCSSLLSSTSLRDFNLASSGMLGYKPTTSAVTK